MSAVINQPTITSEYLHQAALQQPPGGASAADRAEQKWEQQSSSAESREHTGHTQGRTVHLKSEILTNTTMYMGFKGVVLREIS